MNTLRPSPSPTLESVFSLKDSLVPPSQVQIQPTPQQPLKKSNHWSQNEETLHMLIFCYVSLCVYGVDMKHVCMYVGPCVGVDAHVYGGSKLTSEIFLDCSPPYH